MAVNDRSPSLPFSCTAWCWAALDVGACQLLTFYRKKTSDQDNIVFPSVLRLLRQFNLKKKNLLETKASKCEVEMFHVGDLNPSLSFSKVSLSFSFESTVKY